MCKISFVIPCYRSENTIAGVIDDIKTAMAKLKKFSYEVVLINDSSPDKTVNAIEALVEQNDNILGIDMTKNFGQHAALMAGFHFASGDYVICLDDDGQTPPAEAYKLIEKLDEGYDAVYARYRHKKHSSFRNFGSQMNEFMAEKMLGKPHDLYVSSYFGIRRNIVDEILRYENPFPYVIGLVLRSTSRICNVDVEHKERTVGTSGYSLSKLISLWMNGFTSFSVKPLRIATYAGVTTAIAGFLFFIYVLIVKFSHNPNTPLGWTSIMSMVLIIGGMNLMVLGMIGEYIGRMYISMNNSPQYVIRKVIKK
ncbi:glycosyltransferase family 2 protein [Butyrivibrio sp. YAB3001]|uniref:glycosyltransferase family 2 protein n=1 Tax=Butyrivibrio sp. YAB3001 TaxID=1520812 RepID=UPI0008F63B2B|nr:glycosyltransferase family 2 protein [Butyrivibrio sp. YAB3001]SFC74849.1 undecaprenyl-phosphate 4-deoxy-4-formamido-L-arabinose transferase [Butyrivibrio sp. YAB3001]